MKDIPLRTPIVADAEIVSETRNVSRSRPRPQKAGVSLNDLLIILFRHKKKIIGLSLLGFAGAAAVYFTRPTAYKSEAKLLVKYVISRSDFDSFESEVGMDSGRPMPTALDTEMQILTSWDVVLKVAETVGPAKLLPNAPSEEATAFAAASSILKNLTVENGHNSQVISVSYTSADPTLAVETLKDYIRIYFDKHLEIHRPGSDFKTADARKSDRAEKLEVIEKALEVLRAKHHVNSATEGLASLEGQRARAKDALMLAQAELNGQLKIVESLEARGAGATTASAPTEPREPTYEEVDAYRQQLDRRAALSAQKFELLRSYKEGSPQVLGVQRQINEAEATRAAMVRNNPGLAQTMTSVSGVSRQPMDLGEARGQQQALEARVAFFKSQLAQIETDFNALAAEAPQFAKLEREQKAGAEQLALALTALQKATENQKLEGTTVGDTSKMPNIDIVQHPSIALKATDKTTMMLMLGLAGGGLAGGIALALLIELLFDKSVKRAQEIESSMHLPLMLSIPFLKTSARWDQTGTRRIGDASAPTPWDEGHFIRPFADAIRDRLGYHFDVNGLTHKPKLIGLTGFSEDAGASTIAASLAASFADAVDGKVLFVDLNGGKQTVLEGKTQDDIGFQEQGKNLLIANIPGQKGRNFVPRQLYDLIPRFKASDFEYIVFNMPPVGPTSPTQAMAGLMDKVLLVIDAGKTNRQVIRRGYEELLACRADVSSILNKTRETLPGWLED